MRGAVLLPTALAALLLLGLAGGVAGQQTSRARAVLFYSPTCPHCHDVMTVNLPPLVREYGDRLQIVTINTMSPGGQALYRAAIREFAIPDERLGVPTLIMGSTVLVGSGEIPAQFPGMVQRALASGGQDWPALPELRTLLAEQGLLDDVAAPVTADSPQGQGQGQAQAPAPDVARTQAAAEAPGPRTAAPAASVVVDSPTQATSAPAAAPVPPAVPSPDAATGDTLRATDLAVLDIDAPALGMLDRFRLDPTANAVAVVVLLAMLAALGAVLAAFARRAAWRPWAEWLIPVVALVGIGVAAYLAFVEVTGATAVCGPVGDCNTVQQSTYARIAGVLPVGVAGVAGYLLLLGAWVIAIAGPARARPSARVVLWGTALLGTLFSVYLTFLEPFVIGATCAWCIASAVAMTALLLLATPRALALRNGASPEAS